MMRILPPKQVSHHNNVYSLQSAKHGKVLHSSLGTAAERQIASFRLIERSSAKGDCGLRTIFDPLVHGLIQLNLFDPIDLKALQIIESPAFQRLKGISQLGLVSLGATGTRYEHSIGVFQVARRILDNLEKKHSLERDILEQISKYKEAICLAALLHDIGHGPLSHDFEQLFLDFNHEHWSKKIIAHNQIANILGGETKDLVLKILNKDSSLPSWVISIVSSQIDADRIDYLGRDRHNLRQFDLPFGTKQANELISAYRIVPNDAAENILVIDFNALNAVNALLSSRHQFMGVWSSNDVLSRKALWKARIEQAGINYSPEMSVEEFLSWDDAWIESKLKNICVQLPSNQVSKAQVLNGRRRYKSEYPVLIYMKNGEVRELTQFFSFYLKQGLIPPLTILKSLQPTAAFFIRSGNISNLTTTSSTQTRVQPGD